MAFILYIESATKVCSVALSEDDRLIAIREENTGGYAHSSLLTSFMEEVLDEAGITAKDLAAVCVSMGPGSYTGLRIGVSAAKGLCYGLDIPLIAIDTPEAMAHHCSKLLSTRTDMISATALEAIFCPMIDARRMEVYTCLFDCRLQRINDIEAMVVESDSFSDILDGHKLFVFGDGAEKCKDILTRKNAVFFDHINPSASGLIEPAYKKFQNKEFVDLAYFEPFYLKDFVAGKPKVKGL
jgi:tRNA threonylcarbamoyladenosine biosynthesis protein TsaB